MDQSVDGQLFAEVRVVRVRVKSSNKRPYRVKATALGLQLV